MAHLSRTTSSSPTPRPCWRRGRRRHWTRPNGALPVVALLAVIPSLPRAELARLTERLIDRMDEMDDDPDFEDDDPSGGSADDVGEIEGWRDQELCMDPPRYGPDQSLGPVNEVDASRNLNRARQAAYHKERRRD